MRAESGGEAQGGARRPHHERVAPNRTRADAGAELRLGGDSPLEHGIFRRDTRPFDGDAGEPVAGQFNAPAREHVEGLAIGAQEIASPLGIGWQVDPEGAEGPAATEQGDVPRRALD